MGFLIVFLGGGFGSACRYGVGLLGVRLLGSSFPYSTLFINVLGSFLMGALVEFFAIKGQLPQSARLLLTTGVMGGFTTFSTFSLETVLMFQRGSAAAAITYVLASIILGLAALALAMLMMRQWIPG